MMASTDKERQRQRSTYDESPKKLRIVLVGKTGSGKSSAGNTILGPDNSFKGFNTEASIKSITKTCAIQKVKIGEKWISVIDTPGQLDTSMSEQEMKTEMEKCAEMSAPGPHVFLLVIRVGRFTEEEKNAVKWIQENFGEESVNHTIILFTHADALEGKPLDEYIIESQDLMAFVNECGGRFHSFNNKDIKNRDQVTELLEKIEKMVKKNGGQHYSNDMYREAQEKIEWEAWKQKTKDYATAAAAAAAAATLKAGVAAAGATLELAGRAATAALEALGMKL